MAAYTQRANAYREMGRSEQALQDYNRALDMNAGYVQARFHRGLLFSKMRLYDKAISDFTSCIQMDSSASQKDYHRSRGEAYSDWGQPLQAIADFNEVLRLDPTDSFSITRRASALVEIGQYDTAIIDYNRALSLEPNNYKLYWGRAVANGRSNRLELMISDFDQAIHLNTTDAQLFDSRGLAYGHLGQDDRALADFDRAISLKSDFASAYEHRGIAHENMRLYDLAVQDYDSALRLDPTLQTAATNITRARAALAPAELDQSSSLKSAETNIASQWSTQSNAVEANRTADSFRPQTGNTLDCYLGIWHENDESNDFLWSFQRIGSNNMRLLRNDNWVWGDFQPSGDGWTGWLIWGNKTRWDGVTLRANETCNVIATNQSWWFKR